MNVVFVVDNEPASSDSGIEITVPAEYATGLSIGGKRKVVSQLSKRYRIPKSYFTLEGYPRIVVSSSKTELPTLKVALQVVPYRPDGTVGIAPAELARVLRERGGYGDQDLIFLITADGDKFRIPLEKLPEVKAKKARMLMFAVRILAPHTYGLSTLEKRFCHSVVRY